MNKTRIKKVVAELFTTQWRQQAQVGDITQEQLALGKKLLNAGFEIPSDLADTVLTVNLEKSDISTSRPEADAENKIRPQKQQDEKTVPKQTSPKPLTINHQLEQADKHSTRSKRFKTNEEFIFGSIEFQSFLPYNDLEQTGRHRSLVEYPWVEADEEAIEWLVERVNPIDGKWKVEKKNVTLAISALPWYEKVYILRLTRVDWERRAIYYLITEDNNLFRLNGTSPPIHEVNRKAPIMLTEDNAVDYLIFFCFFVRGDEGPFYVLETDKDPILPENLDKTSKKVISSVTRIASFEGRNAQGHFLCDAVIFYSNALFLGDFVVQTSGMVEMLNDEPIAGDLSSKIDAPLV